ncbi:hypothetical protein Mgra_00003302 [Meloidogyne graminicola]|uniref:Uncharacterized protein n=1 Tax=Meloidogyne graminicola TaxID=189291 RepID=A0A8S9ZW18_9BILA|nr:hypothetical protein Mgra_00003302 [Meloidogyne graminicola]
MSYSAILFALQIAVCVSWGVDVDVLERSTNVTVLPKLNKTYPTVMQPMETTDSGVLDAHLDNETFTGFNFNTTANPVNTTAPGDVCFVFSCNMFYAGMGTIVVVLALAIFIVGICLYAYKKQPYVLSHRF